MRTILLTLIFSCAISTLFGQENNETFTKGAILELSEPLGHNYKHIDFPKRNIIIKRGAIADFNSLIGMELVVADLNTDANGNTTAILKRKDGLSFFRFFPTVEADLGKAIATGEIKRL